MTTDEMLSYVEGELDNRNDVAAVASLFMLSENNDKLMQYGKHFAKEIEVSTGTTNEWSEKDKAILKKFFARCRELGNEQRSQSGWMD